MWDFDDCQAHIEKHEEREREREPRQLRIHIAERIMLQRHLRHTGLFANV